MRRHIAILTAVLCLGACAAAATASADPPALFTRPGELLGHTLRFRGALPADQAGKMLLVQRQEANGAWTQTATATIAPGMTQTSTIGVVPQRGAKMAPPQPAPSPYAGTGGAAPTTP